MMRDTWLRFAVLQPPDIERIHELAMCVLEQTGIVLHYPPARRLLRSYGAAVDEATGLARIPRGLVERALATAPHAFTLHGGKPGRDCQPGSTGAVYARTGTGLNWFVARSSRFRRPVTIADLAPWIRVAHALPNIHLVGALYDQEGLPQAMDV